MELASLANHNSELQSQLSIRLRELLKVDTSTNSLHWTNQTRMQPLNQLELRILGVNSEIESPIQRHEQKWVNQEDDLKPDL